MLKKQFNNILMYQMYSGVGKKTTKKQVLNEKTDIEKAQQVYLHEHHNKINIIYHIRKNRHF